MSPSLLPSRALVLLLLLLPGSVRAGEATKLRALLEDGRYAEVIERAEAYLARPKAGPELDEVRLLRERAAWLEAAEASSIPTWRLYLLDHPDSPYTEGAEELLSVLVFEQEVRPAGTGEAYAAFRREFPSSSRVPEALWREELSAWQQAAHLDTIAAYRAFSAAWPRGRYVAEAARREGDLAYAGVRLADDLDGYLRFLHDYPDSAYAAEARERSEAVAWARAQSTDAIAAWRAYHEAFPEGERARRARAREEELAWGGATAAHSIQAYRAFELAYPASPRLPEAERREWGVYHYERAPYPGELQARVGRSFRLPDGTWRLYLDVTDAEGGIVGGLRPDNFRLYDAAWPAEVVEVAGTERDRPLDIVFVLDVTGSMGSEIEGVKEGIILFAEAMRLRSRDARYALVTFNDRVASVLPGGGKLSADVRQFQRWVGEQRADGGGDSPENPLDGMALAAGLAFRPDAQPLIVMITDAPAHQADGVTRRTVAQVLGLTLERGVTTYVVGPDRPEYHELSEGTGGAYYRLDRRAGFAQTMLAFTEKLSKQYRLVYRRPPEAPPVIDQLKVVVRVRGDYAWLPSTGGGAAASALLASPSDARLVWRLNPAGRLECSADGGAAWAPCGGGVDGRLTRLVEAGDLWALDDAGRLWSSRDGGVRFEPGGLAGAVGGVFGAGREGVYAWIGGTLWRRSGAGWSEVQHLAHPILLGAAGPEGGLLLLDAQGGLWRSSDGGVHLVAVEGPPWGRAPLGLAWQPNRRGLVFAWGPDGLYRSLSGGSAWTRVSDEATTGLAFDPTVRQLVLAFGPGGVRASDDLGRSWFPWGVGLDRAGGGLAAVRADGRMLYAGPDGALWGLARVTNREYISSSVYFASGAAEPDESLLPHLEALADQLRRNPGLVLRVEGHTDSDGSDEFNLDLSRRRAAWVCDHLARLGVPKTRLIAVGYGETKPLFPNSSAEGKARNRRVELALLETPRALPVLEGVR